MFFAERPYTAYKMILDMGLIDYEDALKTQRELVSKRKLQIIGDLALVVEHPSVFTIGRSGSRNNLLVDEKFLSEKGIKVLDVDRGGDITFHSPGQLVAYPIIDLKKRVRDLHNYLRELEEVVVSFLKKYGVKGVTRKGSTGVWVGEEKIAFIGVAAKDWVTYHGLSVNISNDIEFFSMINPCGIKSLRVTSLAKVSRQAVPMYEAKKVFSSEFNKVFGVPQWLKKRVVVNSSFFETKKALADFSVNTVCESSMCPNQTECFSKKFAAFMILGKVCTRSCGFCSVAKGESNPTVPSAGAQDQSLYARIPSLSKHRLLGIDTEEPARIAGCVERLGLKHVVLTSVSRDDVSDGGASQFARAAESIRCASKDIVIELLVPDFGARKASIETIVRSGADIIGHNIETVRRLYPVVRSRADYSRSLAILRTIKELKRGQLTKSAILVGLGEKREEVVETMKDLRASDCDMLTIGQYLMPGKENLPVARFVTPEEFGEYKTIGEEMGFKNVNSAPFARSSYFAEENFKICFTKSKETR